MFARISILSVNNDVPDYFSKYNPAKLLSVHSTFLRISTEQDATRVADVPLFHHKMYLTRLIAFVFAVCFHLTLAILEEPFIGFTAQNGSLDIAGASIVVGVDDFIGIHIAVKSLINDLEQITGVRPEVRNLTINATLWRESTASRLDSAIIVGSANSSLIRQLSAKGAINVSDVREWETFKTGIVTNPLSGISKAFVIVGSDKRGTIFGIHTLAEQCGQSP